MNKLWTSTEAVTATGGKPSGTWIASGVSIDTRTLNKGDLFIALKGENFDGHNFVETAFEKGAVASIVSKIPEGLEGESRLLLVDDTQNALENLAKYRRSKIKAKMIAVTGSVGKTSTKEMLAHVLKEQGKTHVTTGNLNNHIGLPLTLCRMEEDCEYGVFELGMNHAGEISALTRILKPHVAVITTIEAAHLEFFGTTEKIACAKAEIFEGLEPDGIAVLPFDSPHYKILAQTACSSGARKVYSFGTNEGATFKLLDYNGEAIKADLDGNVVNYKLGLKGRHQAINSLAVLAAIKAVKTEIKSALTSLAGIYPASGRGKIYHLNLRGQKITLIDDSYNASPASMKAAFAVLSSMRKSGRIIAALGNMLELGDSKVLFHEELAKDIVANEIDKVFTAGELMAHLHAKLPERIKAEHRKTAMELLPDLKRQLKDGDVLLIKGSHGSHMWKLAEEIIKIG